MENHDENGSGARALIAQRCHREALLEAANFCMNKVLVDSDIVIDFLRTGAGALPRLLQSQREKKLELFLSSVTVLELFAGKSSKKTTEALKEFIDGFTVIPLGRDLAIFAGQIRRDARVSGSLGDLVVAASTLSIGAKLATRNKRYYQTIPKFLFYPIASSAL